MSRRRVGEEIGTVAYEYVSIFSSREEGGEVSWGGRERERERERESEEGKRRRTGEVLE